MPTIRKRGTDVADGAVVYPLQGSQYEYLPFNARIDIALMADTGDTFLANVFSGSDVLMENAQIDNLATASPIVYPDHFTLTDVAMAGERLGIALTNNTGAVADYRVVVMITPL
ncbi:MAG: hypothetical protein P8099_19960 [Gemmatimonadota bacterium]